MLQHTEAVSLQCLAGGVVEGTSGAAIQQPQAHSAWLEVRWRGAQGAGTQRLAGGVVEGTPGAAIRPQAQCLAGGMVEG